MSYPLVSFAFWLRIRGHGISIHNGPAYFSERKGYRKVLRIFGVAFEMVKP